MDSFDFLINQKNLLEAQINELSSYLDAVGVGIKGSLLDNEGFPRPDLDIPLIRLKRHEIICISRSNIM